MNSRQAPCPVVTWLIGFMMIFGVCGCNREPGEKHRVTVVLLVDSRVDPLRNMQTLLLGHLVQQEAGYDFRWWDARGDGKIQAAQLSEASKLKPDVLMVFPVESAAITDGLTRARQAGAQVFVFADDVPEAACSSAIFCDERKAGRIAGEFVVQSVRQKLAEEGRPEAIGRVVQLTGPEDNAVSAQRKEGFAEALAHQREILIVHQAPAGLLGEGVSERVAEALNLQKNFDVVFAHDDLVAREAAQALVKAGLRDNILVMGMDGALGKGGGIQMVTSSEIDATVYHPPLVEFAWVLAQRALRKPGYKPSPRYELQPVIVNLEKAIEWTRTGPSPAKPD